MRTRSNQVGAQFSQIGYCIGTRINIDVLNAQQQQQLFTAQRDLLKARVDTLLQGLRQQFAGRAIHQPAPAGGALADVITWPAC